MSGIGGHQSAAMLKDEWLTPPWILQALGPFDLDPCAPVNPPWRIAKKLYTVEDDGLRQPWEGRVWLNPPYGARVGAWMRRLAEHGDGIALIFARTETESFMRWAWGRAHAMLFLSGRLTFCHASGVPARHNGGAPSVLLAYGTANADALAVSGIPGAFVHGWGVQEDRTRLMGLGL